MKSIIVASLYRLHATDVTGIPSTGAKTISVHSANTDAITTPAPSKARIRPYKSATSSPIIVLSHNPPCKGSVGRYEPAIPVPLTRTLLECTNPKKSAARNPQQAPPIMRAPTVLSVPSVKTLATRPQRKDTPKSSSPSRVLISLDTDAPAGLS